MAFYSTYTNNRSICQRRTIRSIPVVAIFGEKFTAFRGILTKSSLSSNENFARCRSSRTSLYAFMMIVVGEFSCECRCTMWIVELFGTSYSHGLDTHKSRQNNGKVTARGKRSVVKKAVRVWTGLSGPWLFVCPLK